MLRPLWLVPLLPLLVTCETPTSSVHVGHSRQRVVRGAINHGDPAVAFLAIRASEGGSESEPSRIKSVCSGTLIAVEASVSSRFVLTARHCVRDARPEQIAVFFATRPNINQPGYEVAEVALHPDTDLAVLALTDSPPAEPVPLNRRSLDDFVGQVVRVTGFGVTATGAQDAGVKRVGSAVIVSANTEGVVGDSTRVELDGNDDIAVVGPGEVGQTICSGDSGGPGFLVVDGVEVVAAVTSFSYGPPLEGQDVPDCTHPETVAGVVRVDKNLDWITAFMRGQEPPALADAATVDKLAGGCNSVPFDGTWLIAALLLVAHRPRRRCWRGACKPGGALRGSAGHRPWS